MAQNETPQPITRAEFEAGIEFYFKPNGKITNPHTESFHVENIATWRRYIEDKRGSVYCQIQRVDDDRFVFIHFVFGIPYEGTVFFKNCFKLIN